MKEIMFKMIKHIGLIAMLLFFASVMQAQELQFNQVKLVDLQETVPAGKVWKVVSVMSPEVRYPTNGSSFVSNSRIIGVGGDSIAIYEEFLNGAGLGFNGCCGGGSYMTNLGSSVNNNETHLIHVSREMTKLPLWLPAGTTLAAGSNVTKISVIEFNVIP
jgi:hypothetical protein